MTKKAIKRLVFRSGIHKLTLLLNRFHIIAYHSISDHATGFFPETLFPDFINQIDYLAHHYRIVSLDEILERLAAGKPLRRSVVITFDDGFRDNYDKAYPILKKHRLPATIYLTTGSIDDARPPWFIRLRSLFMQSAKDRLSIRLGADVADLPIHTAAEKRAASDIVMNYLLLCPDEERLAILEMLPSLTGTPSAANSEPAMLTWPQIREMSGNGITFGAHSVTHPVLSRISPGKLRFEIEASQQRIEEEIGRPVTHFAYPFGRKIHYPDAAPRILQQLRFASAVTTEPGANSSTADRYRLRRAPPWELSLW